MVVFRFKTFLFKTILFKTFLNYTIWVFFGYDVPETGCPNPVHVRATQKNDRTNFRAKFNTGVTNVYGFEVGLRALLSGLNLTCECF